MTQWRSVDSITMVTDSDYDCGGKCVDKDDKEENDDNWVIWWWSEGGPTVTLLVVYQSCSPSPFASTIGFDLIGSNFYNLPPPSLLPTTLFIKTEQYRNENDKMGKTGVCPMNIHEMRSTLQRKRRQNFFRALNCKTSLKRGCRQIKLDCKQKI